MISPSTKRRLSVGGSAMAGSRDSMEEESAATDDGAKVNERLDTLELQMAATMKKTEWTFQQVKMMQKREAMQTIIITPWDESYAGGFWDAANELLASDEVVDMAQKVDILDIIDTLRNQLRIKVSQSSKLQQLVATLRGVCDYYRLPMRVQQSQSNAEQQVAYLPRALYKLLEGYLGEYGISAAEWIKSVLPSNLDAPGFEHAMQVEDKSVIIANAMLVETDKTQIMQIYMCDSITVKEEKWDLSEVAAAFGKKVDEFAGFPYLCNLEIVKQEALKPIGRRILSNGKAVTDGNGYEGEIPKAADDANTGKNSINGKISKHGKGNGKGKGGANKGKVKGKEKGQGGKRGKGKKGKEGGKEW